LISQTLPWPGVGFPWRILPTGNFGRVSRRYEHKEGNIPEFHTTTAVCRPHSWPMKAIWQISNGKLKNKGVIAKFFILKEKVSKTSR
jgi:hypothetical protein